MDDKIKKLEKELKYLTKDVIKEEIEKNKNRLENEDAKIIANDIYLNRGLDITKLKRNITSNLINDFSSAFSDFKNKDKDTKKRMIIDIIYFVLLLLLMKIPFDLIRDIGYEYIELISNNSILITTWNLIFLLLYTITIICVAIVLIRNFNKKYVK